LDLWYKHYYRASEYWIIYANFYVGYIRVVQYIVWKSMTKKASLIMLQCVFYIMCAFLYLDHIYNQKEKPTKQNYF